MTILVVNYNLFIYSYLLFSEQGKNEKKDGESRKREQVGEARVPAREENGQQNEQQDGEREEGEEIREQEQENKTEDEMREEQPEHLTDGPTSHHHQGKGTCKNLYIL